MGAESQVNLAIDVVGIRDMPDALADDLDFLPGEFLPGSPGNAADEQVVGQVHLARGVSSGDGVGV